MSGRPLNEGRTPKFYARDGTMLALAASVRERRRQRHLAYEFDPGLALAEQLTRPDPDDDDVG